MVDFDLVMVGPRPRLLRAITYSAHHLLLHDEMGYVERSVSDRSTAAADE
jgi:hypothetical protein